VKLIKVFAVFFILHAAGWAAAHVYLNQNPKQVLLVVDTSYSMKPKFTEIEEWIDDFAGAARYQTIRVGTDKAMLGKLDELKSRSVIFRTAFGRMTEGSLEQYHGIPAKEKILLSDGAIKPEGWTVVAF
jgi:hypothetical protein